MSGKPSYRTKAAMELVREGITPYAAAKQMKLHISTIYRSQLYKAWQAENDAKNKPKRTQQPDPRTVLAVDLIKKGEAPAEACRQAKIHRATLYQSPLYARYKIEAKVKEDMRRDT